MMARTLPIGMLLASLALSAGPLDPSAARAAEPTLLRFRVEIDNDSARPIAGATVDIAVPATLAPQRLVRLTGSLPVERVALGDGQTVARVALPTVPPHGRVPITVDALIARDDEATAATSGTTAGLLEPTPGVPSDDPEIARAARLAARGDGALNKVRGIYQRVRQRVTDDGYHARDRGALFALERGLGDCTEMAQLTVALARAAGIPARLAHGYRADGAALVDPDGYHAFALVDLGDGGPLRVIDPQAGLGPDGPARDRAAYVVTRLDGPADAGFHRVRTSTPDLTARVVAPEGAEAPNARRPPRTRRPRVSDAVPGGQTRTCTTTDDGAIACHAVEPVKATGGCCR